MKIERFEVQGLAQYSYVVSSDGEAAVVDPIRDIERYTTYAAQHKLTIAHILETHIHADFASGATALAKATGAQLGLSGHDCGQVYEYAMPHTKLLDGDTVRLGSLTIQAMHTPGHTPEHLSFLVFDGNPQTSKPSALFSGDFLFFGSLGRPDLLGEGAKVELAHELYRSLHRRTAHLPDNLPLFPGHGAGSFCGAGMRAQSESTLGQERATNSFFHLAEDAFVAEILASVPEMPSYYPRMKELNAKGASILQSLPGDRPLSVSEVAELSRNEDAVLLDVRSAESFAGAHIPGSINIGGGPNLSLWAGWLLDPAQRIALIGENGDEETARVSLIRVGLDCIEGHLADGMAGWLKAGQRVARTVQFSPQEVAASSEQARIVDVRNAKEWAGGHIAAAETIPLGDLPGRLEHLRGERPIVTVCEGGYRSSIAASLLMQRGLSNIGSMAGGMAAWNRDKLPVSWD